jgi:hypothetical protein
MSEKVEYTLDEPERYILMLKVIRDYIQLAQDRLREAIKLTPHITKFKRLDTEKKIIRNLDLCIIDLRFEIEALEEWLEAVKKKYPYLCK